LFAPVIGKPPKKLLEGPSDSSGAVEGAAFERVDQSVGRPLGKEETIA
jgi:hypothetical protein